MDSSGPELSPARNCPANPCGPCSRYGSAPEPDNGQAAIMMPQGIVREITSTKS
jgi:hypothetical protein